MGDAMKLIGELFGAIIMLAGVCLAIAGGVGLFSVLGNIVSDIQVIIAMLCVVFIAQGIIIIRLFVIKN